jgi:hypothetical protein
VSAALTGVQAKVPGELLGIVDEEWVIVHWPETASGEVDGMRTAGRLIASNVAVGRRATRSLIGGQRVPQSTNPTGPAKVREIPFETGHNAAKSKGASSVEATVGILAPRQLSRAARLQVAATALSKVAFAIRWSVLLFAFVAFATHKTKCDDFAIAMRWLDWVAITEH